jgi:hypothetical protein
MAAQFEEDGIRFQYPENWKLEREENDTGWTVSVQSPETAFMLISVRTDLPTPEEMVETVLEALREDYADLEADDCIDSLAGQPAIGYNIRFFSLDLTNTGWTRSFYCAAGTVVVLCQTNDLELERNEPILRAICASLQVEDD